MRVTFHDTSVHKCTWVTFITITNNITNFLLLPCYLFPFITSLKTSATTSTKI